jgi:hypothetical protein
MYSPLEQFDIRLSNLRSLDALELLFSKPNLSFLEQLKCAFFFFSELHCSFLINDFALQLLHVFLGFVLITVFFFNTNVFLIPTYWTVFF